MMIFRLQQRLGTFQNRHHFGRQSDSLQKYSCAILTMWGAIQSDLISFVTTITDDTAKTINRVLGEDVVEEVQQITSSRKKVGADVCVFFCLL